MNDFDRKLVDLITELTDEGTVWPLAGVTGYWGREIAARLITDGFAVVYDGEAARRFDRLENVQFLPVDEALVLLHHLRKADDYVIAEAPWAPICLEDYPDLIFRYAADDPEAVAEVRQRHAERRARLCR